MPQMIRNFAITCATAAVFYCIGAGSSSAIAGDDTGLSCSKLWFERNKIYADNGFCFKTARARRQFGAGCFAPFGRLTGFAKRRVQRIQQLERINGC